MCEYHDFSLCCLWGQPKRPNIGAIHLPRALVSPAPFMLAPQAKRFRFLIFYTEYIASFHELARELRSTTSYCSFWSHSEHSYYNSLIFNLQQPAGPSDRKAPTTVPLTHYFLLRYWVTHYFLALLFSCRYYFHWIRRNLTIYMYCFNLTRFNNVFLQYLVVELLISDRIFILSWFVRITLVSIDSLTF